MPKWSEMLARLIPWLDTDDGDADRQVRDETADMQREQQELAPFIADQTEYLISKGQVNGFSGQLRLGFQQRATQE
jgi:hypothetical protein